MFGVLVASPPPSRPQSVSMLMVADVGQNDWKPWNITFITQNVCEHWAATWNDAIEKNLLNGVPADPKNPTKDYVKYDCLGR